MKFYNNYEEYKQASYDKEGNEICCDCGILYRNMVDFVIDDELWSEITPTAKFDSESGILCPTCILNRLAELGIYPEGYSTKFEKGCKKINGKYDWES